MGASVVRALTNCRAVVVGAGPTGCRAAGRGRPGRSSLYRLGSLLHLGKRLGVLLHRRSRAPATTHRDVVMRERRACPAQCRRHGLVPSDGRPLLVLQCRDRDPRGRVPGGAQLVDVRLDQLGFVIVLSVHCGPLLGLELRDLLAYLLEPACRATDGLARAAVVATPPCPLGSHLPVFQRRGPVPPPPSWTPQAGTTREQPQRRHGPTARPNPSLSERTGRWRA